MEWSRQFSFAKEGVDECVSTQPHRRLGGRFAARLSKAVRHALRERDRVEMAGIALLSTASTRRRARR
jgi:hypothetical protein